MLCYLPSTCRFVGRLDGPAVSIICTFTESNGKGFPMHLIQYITCRFKSHFWVYSYTTVLPGESVVSVGNDLFEMRVVMQGVLSIIGLNRYWRLYE